MIDDQLISDIRAAAGESVRECSTDESAELLTALRFKLRIRDDDSTWWWQSLAVPSVRHPYDDPSAASDLILATTGDPAQQVYLVVTDDEPPPWPVFRGSLRDVLDAVADQRFFEYAIVTQDHSVVIFDTHHNELIVAPPPR